MTAGLAERTKTHFCKSRSPATNYCKRCESFWMNLLLMCILRCRPSQRFKMQRLGILRTVSAADSSYRWEGLGNVRDCWCVACVCVCHRRFSHGEGQTTGPDTTRGI